MRILIVGSTSTVGRAAGRALSRSHSVSYAGRREADLVLDLASPGRALPGDLRFDEVIHVAADFGGEKDEDIVRAEAVNAGGTLQVCRIALQARARHLIVISSVSADYAPGDPYFGAYSLSKRHGDELAMLYCGRFGLPLAILRPTQIYDAESRCRTHQRLFYSIIDKAMKGEDIVFHGSNDPLRSYIFVDDVAEIIARVVEAGTVGTYYCPAKRSVRLSRIARIAYGAFETEGRVVFDPEKPSIPDLKACSGKGLYRKLGYEPPTGLAEGIGKIRRSRSLL